ncbi:duplicated orphan permease [Luteibacter sp. UNC138MFCol5.1]|nr:duplicated orphan permease [Luteibacter sp. UNC138MFCol5.1]
MTWATEVARAGGALLRQPAFLALASVTLSLGVAALLGAFTLLDALFVRPLPWPNHERVVIFGGRTAGDPMRAISPRLYAAIAPSPLLKSHGLAYMPEPVNATWNGRDELLRAQRVDAGFLDTLGVRADAGRVFRGGTGNSEVMLSHALWKRGFGGSGGAVGSTIVVDGSAMHVVGVLPRDYRFFSDVDLLILPAAPPVGSATAENMTAVGLLGPGVGPDALSRAVALAVNRDAAALHLGPDDMPWYGATPIDDLVARTGRAPVWPFVFCAWLVLILAALNVANLMLVRSLRRSPEIALQVALGASGWRPFIPALTEGAMVAIVATLLGLPLGTLVVVVYRPFLPDLWIASAAPPFPEVRTVCATFLVTAAIALVAALCVAARRTSDAILRQQLAANGAGIGSPGMRRARAMVTLSQSALATVLLILGVATVTRYTQLEGLPLGFDQANTAVVEVHPDRNRYPETRNVMSLLDEIRRKATGLPGVAMFGWSSELPLGTRFVMPFRRGDGGTDYLRFAMVTPGAAKALGFQKVAGRWFDEGDVAGAPAVAIVNRAYLEKIDGRGLGADLRQAGSATGTARIVGVLADTRRSESSDAMDGEPLVVMPIAQVTASYGAVRNLLPIYAVLRGPGARIAAHEAFTDLVRGIAPGLALGHVRPLDRIARLANAAARRDAVLFATLAAFAVSLACVGHYSVQAFEVAAGTRTLAIRSALGATPAALVTLIVRHALGNAVPGVALGLLGVLVLRHWLSPTHAGAQAVDGSDAATGAAIMILFTTLAVLGPALRAASIDPWRAFRRE